MIRFRFVVALAAVSLFSAGCSDTHRGRQEVAGTVKLKGQLIKDGTVSFEPLDGQPTRATALIAAGEYSIPRASGLLPGKYLIRVSAGDGKTAINPVDETNPPGPGGGTNVISKDLVPADWNVNSKQERTVGKDGPNRFEFEIP
jgi:hypothetical protein